MREDGPTRCVHRALDERVRLVAAAPRGSASFETVGRQGAARQRRLDLIERSVSRTNAWPPGAALTAWDERHQRGARAIRASVLGATPPLSARRLAPKPASPCGLELREFVPRREQSPLTARRQVLRRPARRQARQAAARAPAPGAQLTRKQQPSNTSHNEPSNLKLNGGLPFWN